MTETLSEPPLRLDMVHDAIEERDLAWMRKQFVKDAETAAKNIAPVGYCVLAWTKKGKPVLFTNLSGRDNPIGRHMLPADIAKFSR